MNQKNQEKHSLLSKKLIERVIFSGMLEFGPVLIFLASFRYLQIYEATALLMISTIISTVVTHRLEKRIPYLALYVAAITLLFGFMTLRFHEAKFIQMRDTLYDMTCALTLIIGIMINIPFLKIAFDTVIPMTTRAWDRLTHLWIGYFILIATANEIVRRLFTLHDWFEFKGWMVIATSMFGLISLYLVYEKKDNQ